MSSRLLPRLVSVRKSVQKASSFQGSVPTDALTALSEHVESCTDVVAEVIFGEADDGGAEISISVTAKVEQLCQRCLAPVVLSLTPSTVLTIVRHDQEAQQRLKEVEPLVLDGDELDLYQLVEEELSLNLPAVAMHEGDELEACEQRVAEGLHTLEGAASFVKQSDASLSAEVVQSRISNIADKVETYKPFEGLGDILKSGG